VCLQGEHQVELLHLVVISLISFFIYFLTSFEKYEMSTVLMAAQMVNTVHGRRKIHSTSIICRKITLLPRCCFYLSFAGYICRKKNTLRQRKQSPI